jgi:hypothetical protein
MQVLKVFITETACLATDSTQTTLMFRTLAIHSFIGHHHVLDTVLSEHILKENRLRLGVMAYAYNP